jgi:hypothetical protein
MFSTTYQFNELTHRKKRAVDAYFLDFYDPIAHISLYGTTNSERGPYTGLYR